MTETEPTTEDLIAAYLDHDTPREEIAKDAQDAARTHPETGRKTPQLHAQKQQIRENNDDMHR